MLSAGREGLVPGIRAAFGRRSALPDIHPTFIMPAALREPIIFFEGFFSSISQCGRESSEAPILKNRCCAQGTVISLSLGVVLRARSRLSVKRMCTYRLPFSVAASFCVAPLSRCPAGACCSIPRDSDSLGRARPSPATLAAFFFIFFPRDIGRAVRCQFVRHANARRPHSGRAALSARWHQR